MHPSTILIAFMILVCILMVLVILTQRSEGGALGMGGGPSGFMTARGAGNFLTRTTWILAGLFFACAIALIVVGNMERRTAGDLGGAPAAPSIFDATKGQAPSTSGGTGAAPATPPAASGAAPKRGFGDIDQPPASNAAPSSAPAQK
jgi:preprotein translocase subunit SecG